MNYNTIIIGGGVAGLTAGMYLARANVKCAILEGKFWGGQTALLNKVSNYPAVKETSGFEISNTLHQQLKELNTEMKNELVVNLSHLNDEYIVQTNKNKYVAKNVIVATGAQTTKLGLQDENKYIGRGISYCATCDGNLFKGKVVAVIGLGGGVLEDIKYLHNVCKKVYWIVPNSALPPKISQEISDLNRVNVKYSCELLQLLGDNTLKKVVLYDKIKRKENELSVDGLFVVLGRKPDLSWLNIDVKTNKNGYIEVNKNNQTNKKGIYACGDITSRKLKQIVTACSDGAIAASNIITKA